MLSFTLLLPEDQLAPQVKSMRGWKLPGPQSYSVSTGPVRTVPPLELWTRCGEDTLPGLYLQWLHDALDACKSDYERRCVEQAARRGLQVMEGREVTLP